jgi:Zn-dependent peptidase ImmA (M78 family)
MIKKAEQAAMEILRRFRVEKAPVPVDQIAKKLGATLQYEPFDGDEDVSAMLFRDDKRIIIGVNSAHARTRQRFSIAHECGHLQLHKGKMYVDARVNFRDALSSQAVDSEEIEANAFAAELLMPRSFLLTELKKAVEKHKSHDAEVIADALARAFGVSNQAMEFRLRNLGLLAE